MFGLSPFDMSHAVLTVISARHVADRRAYRSESRRSHRAVRDGAPAIVGERS
jgi:hypothetical protein